MTKDVPSFILNPCPFEYGNSNRGLLGGFNSSYASYIVSPSRLGFQKNMVETTRPEGVFNQPCPWAVSSIHPHRRLGIPQRMKSHPPNLKYLKYPNRGTQE